MTEPDNIEIYRRFIDEGVGVGRLEIIDELLAPGIELPTLPPGFEPTAEGLRAVNLAFRQGFPDLKAVIEEIFASGDWVAARVSWSGTNTGEFFGQPPTQRSASTTEIEIVRVQAGRIVELRQVADVSSLMAQLAG
jgi:predicted ester cyclase